MEYGFVLKKYPQKARNCTKEELEENISKYHRIILFVTTPEMDGFEVIGADPKHMQIIIDKKMHGHKKAIAGIAAITLLFFAALAWQYSVSDNFWPESRFVRLFGVAFGLIPLIGRFFEMYQLRSISCDQGEAEMEDTRFRFWISQQAKTSHRWLPLILLLLYMLQYYTGLDASIEQFGLVKELTRAGEWWRLLTCTLLHGGFIHVLFNAMALFVLGNILVSFYRFRKLLWVCLYSGLVGGLFSMIFYPYTVSVGASGAILGVLGYMMVIGLRFRNVISWNFTAQMIWIAISMAFIGVAGFDFIDNAAHAGGLLGGALLALFETSEELERNVEIRSHRIKDNSWQISEQQ